MKSTLTILCLLRNVEAFSSMTPPPRGSNNLLGKRNQPPPQKNVLEEMLEEVTEEIDMNLQVVAEEIDMNLQVVADEIDTTLQGVADDISDLMEEASNVFQQVMFGTLAAGRAPTSPDDVNTEQTTSFDIVPASPTEAKLIVVQITDVYTLEYFAHVKTLLQDLKTQAGPNTQVVCMLTGDFLSPYLLSSVDRGYGMMRALAETPVDYLTWGNHEADIDHKTVCQHVQNFPGKWINSNMLDHEAMEYQQEYDVLSLKSPDGTNERKLGLCAVLSDDPGLYSHFEEPGAFGGATIDDPWETLTKYQSILEDEHQCDMVLPLQHTYVPDDHKTCRNFDFPVILSGHDHHKVDQVIDGTRLIKPGMNGIYASVLEISWPDAEKDTKPTIRSQFVETAQWEADKELQKSCSEAYDALLPLRLTELAQVSDHFQPLSSGDSRGSVCTMGTFICTHLKTSLNESRNNRRRHSVDAVILMGGNVRGNTDYEEGSYFSLEMLEAEIKSEEVVGIVPMPGWLIAQAIEETHAGGPIPGWMQYDAGIREEQHEGGSTTVTHIAGRPIDPDKVYRVATKISDLTNGQSPSLTEYYKQHDNFLPRKGAYINIHAELLPHFARKLWRELWLVISDRLNETECGLDEEEACGAKDFLDVLDQSGDGIVSVEEIQMALRDLLGMKVHDDEIALAKFVHSFADTTGDGRVTKKDFELFCEEMVEENGALPMDIPQLYLEPEEAEAILEDVRAERGEDEPQPVEVIFDDSITTTTKELLTEQV